MTVKLTHEKKLKTPMLDKMLAVKEKSNAIGDFLEWIGTRDPKLYLCELDEEVEQYYPSFPGIEKLLAEFFEIDLNEAENERMRLIKYVREQNDRPKT